MTLPYDFSYELKTRFTGDLRFDSASKILYATDASMYQIEPLGVAIPKTQADLHALVELASKHAVPILPRGAGTSLVGQAIGEALILDCSQYLNKIIEINAEEQYAIVESGVVLSNLNRAVAKHGLMFGPDPASAERATMGGVIGNNATGAHSIVYGMSADHLLEADVVLSDGSLQNWGETNLTADGGRWTAVSGRQSKVLEAVQYIKSNYAEAIKNNYPKSWRNSAGYRLNYLLPWSPSKPPQWNGTYPANLKPDTWNLAPLLAGSEGTLAVIRTMKVNLVKKPKHTILGILQYQSIAQACDDVPRLLQMKPSAIELIPKMILDLARSVSAVASQMSWMVGSPEAVLVVEFSGDQLSAIKEAVYQIGDVLTIAESNEEQNRIWNMRKMGLGILDSRPQNARPIAFIEDCAIPVERLGEFVREVALILKAHQTEAGIYAHASGGCLHIRPVLDLLHGAGVRNMRLIMEEVFALTMKLGGSMSSEHGDGLARSEFVERTYGKEIFEAMRLLKQAADPDHILNPKKMFDAPTMDSNLRYGENYQVKVWDSALHYEHEHGVAGAIEMCNGQGVCRKSHGVMCPSFQATGDEGLSTRGRANLLRAVISGQRLAVSAPLEEATFQTLDLCLACKGCTSECPSGVDMPKLKYEFMNQYYKNHRRPLHDYLFAYFDVIAKWMQPIAPLTNRLMTMKWSKWLIAKTFGLAENRSLPLIRKNKPEDYLTNQTNPTNQTSKTILFLSDVFSEYVEPEVKQAAIDLLTYFGYQVKVLPVLGSGAALLSKGFVDEAKRHAEKVLDELKSWGAEAIVGVVGCEPPEVYCMKYEYQALLPERKSELVWLSNKVFLVEEFILRVAKLDNTISNSSNSSQKEKIYFHPHCHQRAEGDLATVDLLKHFGFDVQVSEAGCCGMAGTFGFDKEHYALSMQIGELKLLPKIRELGIGNGESSPSAFGTSPKYDGTSVVFGGGRVGVVSSGAACRMQIWDGAGVVAKHPLVLVRDELLNKLQV